MKHPKLHQIVIPILLVIVLAAMPVFAVMRKMGYFTPDPTAEVTATAPEGADELVFVADYDFDPYSYLREDGSPDGLDVEIAYELSNRLGMRPRIEFGTWSECKEKIKGGEADVLLGLEIFVDGAATGTLKSIPVGSDTLSVIGKEAVSDAAALSGKKVGVSFGSALIGLFKLNCEYVEFFTYSEMLEALDSGEIDYGICHASVASRIIEENGYALTPSLVLMESFPTMGIRQDEPELREKINDALVEMSADGTIENLREKWIENYVENRTVSDVLSHYQASFVIYAIAAVIILFTYGIVMLLSRADAERKKNLEAAQAALENEIARSRDEKAYQLAVLNNAYSYTRINLSHNMIIPPIIERENGKPVDYTDKFPQPLPSYEQVFAIGASRYVEDGYKQSYVAYHNCKNLIGCFNRGEFSPEYVCHIYSTKIGWHYRRYITYLSKDESSGDIYGMSVAYDITKEYEAAEKERQYKREIEDTLAFNSYFLDTYISAYYIDLATRKFKVYKVPKVAVAKELELPDDYVQALTAFGRITVHREDLDEFLSIIRPENIREQLRHGDIQYTFRDIYSGRDRIIRMQITRGADDDHATLGFKDVTDEVREQQRRLLGAIPISPDIFAKEHIGMWAFELDEGQSPRMYVDDVMLGLIGLDHQVPPEETYHAWYDHIDEKSYGLVADAVARMCAGEHAEVQYPWHHPNGETWIVRCGGVRNPGYTKGIRVEGTHQNVTEMLRFDEEEIKLRRRMNMIFSLSDEYDPIIVVEPESGEYDWYMSQADELTVNTSMTLHGDSLYKNIGIDGASIIHPDDRAQFQAFYTRENMCRIAESGEPQETENRWFLKLEDRYKWKYNKAVRMVDDDGKVYVVVGVIDTTEAKEKEEQFEAQKKIIEKQRALSDGLAREYHTVWLMEGSGDHKMHLYRSTGRNTIKSAVQIAIDDPSYDSGIIKYVHDYVHEDDQQRVLEATKFETVERETPETGTYVVSYRRYNPEHTSYDYHQMVYARAVSDNGEVNYIFAYRDADKMIREQIDQQQQLAEALSMAQSANRAKTTFLNSMSHDIRTPMNAIIGYTGLAQNHLDNREQVKDYLEKISRSSDHLLSLINDVLDMSRIESGKVVLEEEPENLTDIVATLDNIVRADIGTRQLAFSIDSDVTDAGIVCDKLRLNQVLLNILSNAVKYTGDGGSVSMSITEKAVKASGYANYEFVITDTGMGMDEQFLQHIFDPFERVRSSTVSGIQGTGLGMAITKNIVDMMGGHIDVRSEPGKGTEVTVDFDFRLWDTPEAPEQQEADYDFTGRKVLLVEDNEMNREIAEEILLEDGFEVETAEDGDIAVEKMRNAKPGDWDIVLMDIQMPRMDGYEATRQIRALGTEISNIPIIAMTANAFDEDRITAIEAGMNEHIAKPIDLDRLKKTLAKFL